MRFAILALASVRAAASLTLAACSSGDPEQLWARDPAHGGHITTLRNTSLCVMIGSGCCGGETIRGGSTLSVSQCQPDYESQKLSWPDAASNWLLRPTSTVGEPSMSALPRNATLVFDARGYAFEGALLLGGALDPIFSTFYATADGHIVNNATQLCVSASAPPASVGQALNLQPCASRKQNALAGFAATQLFALDAAQGRVITSEGLCATAERPLDAAGSARLVSATCSRAAAPLPSQAINFSATDAFGSGHLVAFQLAGAPAADAGAANWWGARVPLTTGAAATTSAFVFTAASGNASLGTLTHAATGLCLDSGGVPAGHGCLDAAVRGLPFCDATLPFDARLADLVGRLTIDEAVGMTGDAGNVDGACSTNTAPIPRLDITAYRWLVEVSSMAGNSDRCDTLTSFGSGCPTSFPAAMLSAGAFNRTLFRSHGDVVGNEMRAISNFRTTMLNGDPGGVASLAGHGPDINQPRSSPTRMACYPLSDSPLTHDPYL